MKRCPTRVSGSALLALAFATPSFCIAAQSVGNVPPVSSGPAAADGPPSPLARPASKPGEIAYGPVTNIDRTEAPLGSPPPSADPHDIRGTWSIDEFREFTTVEGKQFPLSAVGQNIFWYRRLMENSGTPVTSPGGRCAPSGYFLAGKFNVVQTSERIVFLFEELHVVWSIYLNSKHPKKLEPSFMGHSIGHWEGDALVVDVVGFNDETWLDFSGAPRSDALHMIVRISKTDENRRLQFLFTIDDPKMYAAPFTTIRRARWRPDLDVFESNCEAAQIVDPELVAR